MAEPASATTLAAAAVVVPVLSAFGVSLGLRADILVAGFFGSLVAIILLNTVPSEGDTWLNMVQSTAKRMFVALASSLVAGYFAPLVPWLVPAMPETAVLGVSFVIGSGAQKMLAAAVNRGTKTIEEPKL